MWLENESIYIKYFACLNCAIVHQLQLLSVINGFTTVRRHQYSKYFSWTGTQLITTNLPITLQIDDNFEPAQKHFCHCKLKEIDSKFSSYERVIMNKPIFYMHITLAISGMTLTITKRNIITTKAMHVMSVHLLLSQKIWVIICVACF